MGRTRQGHRDAELPTTVKNPRVRQVPGFRPRAAKGGANWHGNGSRCRKSERGAGTSGGGERAAGAGDVQVVGALHRERRIVADEN